MLAIGLSTSQNVSAQQVVVVETDSIVVSADSTLVAEGSKVVGKLTGKKERKIHFINGFGVGADLLGLIQKGFSSDNTMLEVMARVNIKERFFPVFELGLGEADHEGRDLNNRFSIRAPFFRIGCDYNIRYKHADGNRFFAGLRYGFSAYKYDLDSPDLLTDPVWNTSQPFHLHDLSGNAQWLELVFGLETRVWSIVRAGWDVRFKFLLHEKTDEVGEPWFIPGLGKRPDGIGWGGSFKVMFDI